MKYNSTTTRRPVMVNDLTADEIPATRLDLYGPEALTDAELLAVLTQTGKTKRAGIETCRAILNQSGGLKGLARKSTYKEIETGPAKARAILAALEIGRRLNNGTNGKGLYFRNPEDVAGYFGPRLRDETTERFYIVTLNAARRVTGEKMISKGGKTATVVDPAETIKYAINNEANSFVLVHNHPSGNVRASRADIAITKKLQQAGELLDIKLDDHIIICGHDFLSLRTEGLIA